MEDELKEIKEIALKNEKALEEHNCKIEANNKKIMENFANIQNNSIALEILKDYKSENKRLFILLIIILFMWFATIGYLVYVLNDISVEETTTETYTQEINDFNTIRNSTINNGD